MMGAAMIRAAIALCASTVVFLVAGVARAETFPSEADLKVKLQPLLDFDDGHTFTERQQWLVALANPTKGPDCTERNVTVGYEASSFDTKALHAAAAAKPSVAELDAITARYVATVEQLGKLTKSFHDSQPTWASDKCAKARALYVQLLPAWNAYFSAIHDAHIYADRAAIARTDATTDKTSMEAVTQRARYESNRLLHELDWLTQDDLQPWNATAIATAVAVFAPFPPTMAKLVSAHTTVAEHTGFKLVAEAAAAYLATANKILARAKQQRALTSTDQAALQRGSVSIDGTWQQLNPVHNDLIAAIKAANFDAK